MGILERQTDSAVMLVHDFEQGMLSRRQLVVRLMGLGAAFAAMQSVSRADQEQNSTFHALGLDHVALNVSDVARSRDFYATHLGLKTVYDGGKEMCFLGRGGIFFLALFRAQKPGLNHYCYVIQNYDPEEVARTLKAAGLQPRREADRVYFDDPDGNEVQLAGR